MQLKISNIRTNSVNFKAKDKGSINNQNDNFKTLVQYFRDNADVYYSFPDFSLSDNLDSVKELSGKDFKRTNEILDVVTKYLRNQMTKNGKVDFEDEHYTDIQNLSSVIDCKKLTPSAFTDLLAIASDKTRNPNLNLFGTVEALSVYDELKKGDMFSDEDFEIAKENYFQDDCTLLTKEDIKKLDKNSDLFKFEYVKDLENAESKDEVLNNLFKKDNNLVIINYPLIFKSYALTLYNKLINDYYANQSYEYLCETQPEMLTAYERSKAITEDIENNFNTKIAPVKREIDNPEKYSDILDEMYDELCAWKMSGKEDFICPDKLEIPDGEIDEIRPKLRAYLAIYNDKNRGWNIAMTDMKDYLDNFDAVNQILNNRIYEEEFRSAGISDELIDEAHEDSCKYISIASMGDFSSYSDEFKQVLVDFGLPKWVFDIK